MNVDIIVLTEMKKKGTGIENLSKYIHIYSGMATEERAKRGVSILIKKEYGRYVINYETLDERIIKVREYIRKKINNLGYTLRITVARILKRKNSIISYKKR